MKMGKKTLLQKLKSCFSKTLGFNLGIIASLIFAFSGLFFKLTHEMSSFQIVVFHDVFVIIVTAIGLLIKKKPIIVFDRYVWLGSVCYALSNYFFFLALKFMNYGDASAIYYSQPILVGTIAFFFLKEKCSWMEAVITVGMCLGVLLVIQPDFLTRLLYPGQYGGLEVINATNVSITCDPFCESENSSYTIKNDIILPGENSTNRSNIHSEDMEDADQIMFHLSRELAGVMAFGSAFCSTMTFIFSRKCIQYHSATKLCQFSIVTMVIGIIPTSILKLWSFPSNYTPWIHFFAHCFCFAAGQHLTHFALRIEMASVIAIASVSEILFAYILQTLILHHVPTVLSIVGAVIISGGCLGLGIKKYLAERKRRKAESVECEKAAETEGNPLRDEAEKSDDEDSIQIEMR